MKKLQHAIAQYYMDLKMYPKQFDDLKKYIDLTSFNEFELIKLNESNSYIVCPRAIDKSSIFWVLDGSDVFPVRKMLFR